MSNITAVYSGKGGVGKTTFILNLAGVLSNLNKKVLIIDLDIHGGGVEVYLNKKSKKDIRDLYIDCQKENFNLNDYVTKYDQYIDFIPSISNFDDINKIKSCFLDKIKNTSNKYDHILVDLSHGLTNFNDKILKNVDKVYYLFTNDTLDLKNSFLNIDYFKKNKINFKTVLNYSIHLDKNYYIDYDIKFIIKSNIDYTISHDFHEEFIENLISRGQIQTIVNKKRKDYKTFYLIAKQLGA